MYNFLKLARIGGMTFSHINVKRIIINCRSSPSIAHSFSGCVNSSSSNERSTVVACLLHWLRSRYSVWQSVGSDDKRHQSCNSSHSFFSQSVIIICGYGNPQLTCSDHGSGGVVVDGGALQPNQRMITAKKGGRQWWWCLWWSLFIHQQVSSPIAHWALAEHRYRAWNSLSSTAFYSRRETYFVACAAHVELFTCNPILGVHFLPLRDRSP